MKIKTITSVTCFIILLSLLYAPVACTNYEDIIFALPESLEITAEGIKWHTDHIKSFKTELEFYDDGVCLKFTSSLLFFWKKTSYECLYKRDDKAQRLFLSCSDLHNCKIVGEIEENTDNSLLGLFGLSSISFLYKMGYAPNKNHQIFSKKESYDDQTLIKFYFKTESTTLQIARIEIYGQGKNQQKAEKVMIYRYTKHFNLNYIILVAGQNLKTYAQNLYGKMDLRFPSKMIFGQHIWEEML